jgi:hypothetical protein
MSSDTSNAVMGGKSRVAIMPVAKYVCIEIRRTLQNLSIRLVNNIVKAKFFIFQLSENVIQQTKVYIF